MLLPPMSRLTLDEEKLDKRLQRLNLNCSSICWVVNPLDGNESDGLQGVGKEQGNHLNASQGNEEVYSGLDSFDVSSSKSYNTTPFPLYVQQGSCSMLIDSPDEKEDLEESQNTFSKTKRVLTFCCPSPVFSDSIRVYCDNDSVRPLKYDHEDNLEKTKTKTPWLRLKGGLFYWCQR